MALPLPDEVSEHALAFLPPRSLAAFSQTCRAARALVYGSPDQFLWRELFLAHWDDPRAAPSPLDAVLAGLLAPSADAYDWRRELQARVRAEVDPAPLVLCAALDEAAPVDADFFAAPSKNTRWVRAVLRRQRWILLNEDTRIFMHLGDWESSVARLRSVLALEFELDDLRRLRDAPSVDEDGDSAVGDDEEDEEGAPSEQSASEEETGLTFGLPPMDYTHDHTLGYLESSLQAGRGGDVVARYERRKLAYEQKQDIATVRKRLATTRIAARCFVYNLRSYRARTAYGPFLRDGSVNWDHVEAMLNVIALNLLELPAERPPSGCEALRPYSAPGTPRIGRARRLGEVEKAQSSWEFGEREADQRPLAELVKDWAGVQGRWKRYVCFMDYRDLFAFNVRFHGSDPKFFEEPQFMEATRQIIMQLQVDADYEPDEDEAYPPGYAPIKWHGVSFGAQRNEARVEGFTRMAMDGTVRWTWIHKSSHVDDNPQWSSSGVQIGAACSAMGVVGAWTGAFHEDGDPAGPFWMWRVEDDAKVELDN